MSWFDAHPAAAAAAGLAGVAVAALAADWLSKRILLRLLDRFVRETEGRWDDELKAHGVFAKLAHLAPALVIYYGAAAVPHLGEPAVTLIRRGAVAAIVVGLLLAFGVFLNAANAIYNLRQGAAERPIKGYLQVVKLVAYLLGAVVVVAVLLDRSPWVFLSGIGAMTAVLMLVFKDTILSLVASVQLTSNDMIRVGDWISMPQHGADGEVVDLALHTVKVRNWDRTVTTIPTWRLIQEGFQNWRTMVEGGGRRVKRALLLDVTTIRHLTTAEVAELARWELLKDYVAGKQAEIDTFNARRLEATGGEGGPVPHRRRLTNVGTFRAYADLYLRSRGDIHPSGMTRMVRQLAPTAEGLPLEIYCFTTTTAWVEYEGIQADIFDHLLAILPAFGLRAFQQPSGADIAALGSAETGRE